MDKSIRKYRRLDEMKDDEYRYWQSRPVYERMAATYELSEALFGVKDAPDEPALYRTLIRVKRPQG